MIELRSLTRRYAERVAVDDLTLAVATGELLVLVGGSGSGKTTTLRLVNRLIEPTSGSVWIDGVDTRTYVDYSGTIWATIMHRESGPAARGQLLAQIEQYLAGEHGIAVAGALGFENSYALAMRADRARELGLSRISDLARRAPGLEIGGDYEFFARAEWRSLVAAYGLAFRAQRAMDPSLMYGALREREVDVISAFSTDGRIAAFDLVLLEDDRRVIPPYDAIILVSGRLARERPDALAALRELAGTIDAVAMRRMNSAVDAEGRSPAEVAREFLAENRRAD